jgi:hypothetical protein
MALFARDPGGCSSIDEPTSGLHAPCTRDKDCEGSLSCREGSCEEASTVDASTSDVTDARSVGDADAGDAPMIGDAQPDA